MGTLVTIVDFLLLLLLVVHIPRTVWRESGSSLLGVASAAAAIIFGLVSFTAAAELLGGTSSLTRTILLLLYLALVWVIRASWVGQPAE
ncbi:MAG: hypothetical protein WBQ34_12360 [Candidatus Acidiferrales bacterium]